MSPADRRRLLIRFANLIDANAAELATLESLEGGKPIADTSAIDLPETVVLSHCNDICTGRWRLAGMAGAHLCRPAMGSIRCRGRLCRNSGPLATRLLQLTQSSITATLQRVRRKPAMRPAQCSQ